MMIVVIRINKYRYIDIHLHFHHLPDLSKVSTFSLILVVALVAVVVLLSLVVVSVALIVIHTNDSINSD